MRRRHLRALTPAPRAAPRSGPVTLWKRIQPTLQAARVAQQSIDSYRTTGTTDAKGEVTFDVEDGDYFVQVQSYRLDPMAVRADKQSSKWITVQLPGVTRLDGTIRNSDGMPVANTSIWLHSGDQDYSTMSLYHTDAAGRYSIPNLRPHPYALSIVKSVATQSAQRVVPFFESGAPSQILDVTFPPLTARIHGQLTDENGTGKGGVWIGVEYLDAPHREILAGWVGTDPTGNFVFATDSEGHQNGNYFSRMDWGYTGAFTCGGLTPGAYQLELTAMGCMKQTRSVGLSGSVSVLVVTMQREGTN